MEEVEQEGEEKQEEDKEEGEGGGGETAGEAEGRRGVRRSDYEDKKTTRSVGGSREVCFVDVFQTFPSLPAGPSRPLFEKVAIPESEV